MDQRRNITCAVVSSLLVAACANGDPPATGIPDNDHDPSPAARSGDDERWAADQDDLDATEATNQEEIGVSDVEYGKIVAELRDAERAGTLRITPRDDQSLAGNDPLLLNKDALPPGAINHDQVQPFEQDASAVETTFQPTLKVDGGCVPFPAVQADGKWNGGLESTGSANGGCSKSRGQIYARVATVGTDDQHSGARCAILYAWYFPKDGNVLAGHRHDWEGIVVWLDRCDDVNAAVIAVAYSGHGGYKVHRVKDGSPNRFSGKRPRVIYAQDLVKNFEVFPTGESGGSQPLIDWLALTDKARKALNDVSFGKANVPIKDATWLDNFYKAKFW